MDFLILTLITWRIGSLLTNDDEHGPYDTLDRIRHFAGVRYDEKSEAYAIREIAKPFLCLWCMSVWVGAILTLLYRPKKFRLLYPFALSAGAILVNEWTQ